ncbi:N-acetylneuraminate synthase [Metasolibacillus meyeri]|uniref:N-acetylneuraminate synthase n=1 Tax=Metasolibacillus meyeri TaxID=1071052 RepID=UPI000D2FC111|nr:N-acetylneuraminate synthase [Metasolibacillus meyeri]
MNKTYIIAEAGVNHNGSLEVAKELVKMAKEAGADAVKFQTFISEKEISQYADKAEYQKATTNQSESQLEMVKKLELDFREFTELKEFCEIEEIEFLSTPFDFDSANFLINTLKLKTIKIPSGEITNAPFLLAIAKEKVNMILSTGMSTLAEIERALGVIAFGLINDYTVVPSLETFEKAYISNLGQKLLSEKVKLLHCTTEYPAPLDEVNLLAIQTMKSTFGLPVGYSDHTEGIEATIAAVSLGATIIEKHITYDKNAEGPDHRASLEPLELINMVKSIRNVEKALGSGIKLPTESELKNRKVARKSIVADKEIKKGELLTEENITFKRPGDGISPFEFWNIKNSKAAKNYSIDERIEVGF